MPLVGQLKALHKLWKMRMLMESLSHMDLQAHVSTSGPLLQELIKLTFMAPSQSQIGRMGYQNLSETTTSVIQETLLQISVLTLYICKILFNWDGEGCVVGTCCEFNSPPWFCTTQLTILK